MSQTASYSRILVLFAALLTSCGGNEGPDIEIKDDRGLIASMITEVPDHAGVPESFSAMVTASFPADDEQRKRYARFMCVAKRDDVSVDGESATANVRLEDIDGNNTTAQWTFVKENGVWKIQDAPLP